MANDTFRHSLLSLGNQRKNELNNKIRNNIYGYFVINTFWGLVLCGAASFFMGEPFPIFSFLLLTGIYFILALITFRVDYFNEKEERRKRNILLMIWNNLFYLVLAFWFSYVSLSVFVYLAIIQFSPTRLSIFVLIFSLFLSWLLPKKFGSELNQATEKASLPSQQRGNDGFWVIGWMILFLAIFSRLNRNLEDKFGLVIGAAIFGILAMFLLLKFFYQTYKDFQFIKNGII